MSEDNWLRIDLHRLRTNAATLRQKLTVGGAALCAVVKENAYGLGVGPIARTLRDQVDLFAVFSIPQARQLICLDKPILILGPVREIASSDPLGPLFKAGKLHLCLHDPEQIQQVAALAYQLNAKIPVHLHLDTGMSRMGFSTEQFSSAAKTVLNTPSLILAGVYSHPATAESDREFLDQQANQLMAAIRQLAFPLPSETKIHLANSAAMLQSPAYHMDMVRVGLALFGYDQKLCPDLLPIVQWRSRIAHIQKFEKGRHVGYGNTHVLKRPSILGVVCAGYANGYPLALSNLGQVRVEVPQAALAPVVGKVNMEQIILDLTDIPDVTVGTEVQLINDGRSCPGSLSHLAHLAGSHHHEMLTRLSSIHDKRYVGDALNET